VTIEAEREVGEALLTGQIPARVPEVRNPQQKEHLCFRSLKNVN
jgi:hypothetical protein